MKGTGKATPDKKAYSCFNPDYLIGSVHFVNTPKGFYTVDHTAENIKENIINSKEKDYYYHYTTFGIHKEDYNFTIDDYDLNSIASQGQKRMILIAFKFALIKYIQLFIGITPIVLLDDIMSELDKDNQERLLQIIPNDTQVIITNTDLQNLNINKDYKLIDLSKEEKHV